jgi:hypothetical protein
MSVDLGKLEGPWSKSTETHLARTMLVLEVR